MRLASFTDYSLRVLIYLALKKEELATVASIAEAYQISQNHLVKVVHNLALMGLIQSFKGKGGGITLAVAPEKINIGLTIRQLESDSPLIECFTDSSLCKLNPVCKLKGALRSAENAFYESLECHTLQDLLTHPGSLRKALSL